MYMQSTLGHSKDSDFHSGSLGILGNVGTIVPCKVGNLASFQEPTNTGGQKVLKRVPKKYKQNINRHCKGAKE